MNGLVRTEESLLEMKEQLNTWFALLPFQYSRPELNETGLIAQSETGEMLHVNLLSDQ